MIGKGQEGLEPCLSLQHMLDLTQQARIDGQGFDGVDLFLFQPHFDIAGDDSTIARLADMLMQRGLRAGSLVAPVWPSAMGGSAMGSSAERNRFVDAVQAACRVAQELKRLGVRSHGVIRIDSASTPAEWAKDPEENTKRIAETFREAGRIAQDHGERLAAEGEICWGGMHSWRTMQELLERVGMPGLVGFQADLAHSYLYLLGYNAPSDALLSSPYSEEEFWSAYRIMTQALAPWTLDFHIAQTDGSVFGSGDHAATGRHCPVNDPGARLDVARCARHWLLDQDGQLRDGLYHLCCDGCMFPNATLENPQTWQEVLKLMLQVRSDLAAQAKLNKHP
jgi:sugar phosphate isomerase/epimerase